MDFAYAKIPAAGLSEADQARLHALVDEHLTATAAGTLVGWGASVGEPDAQGRRPVAFHRLDVEVQRIDTALPVLRQALQAWPAPAGTELHYHERGQARVERHDNGGWHAVPIDA